MDPSFSLEDIFQKNAKMLRSAFTYISQAGNQLLQSATAVSSTDAKSHPLVGQTLTIGHHSYAVRSLLAEGGYALVFAVESVKNDRPTNSTGGGQWYALKRQLAADREAADAIVREINFLKQLNGHPSIVRFCHATKHRGAADGGRSSSSSFSSPSRHFCEFLVLTELCSGGPLIDVLRQGPMSEAQVCKILYATALAIHHMHDRNPPITHRDIKIENLLFDAGGHIKLCDFGSATTDIYRPCDEWSALVRAQLEEEIAKFTTPMYRAPEVLDTYQNFPIGPAQDIWALGCVLFYLCYRVHPFEDSAKLRILNAKYTLPAHSEYKAFHDLIRQMLQPDPYSRPSIQDLCEQIEQLATELNVPLGEPVLMTMAEKMTTTTPSSSSTNSNQNSVEQTGTARHDQHLQKQQRHEQQQKKTDLSSNSSLAHDQQQKGRKYVPDDEDDQLAAALRFSMTTLSDHPSEQAANPTEKILINFEPSHEMTSATSSSSAVTTSTTIAPRNGSNMDFLFDLEMPTVTTSTTTTTAGPTSSNSTATNAEARDLLGTDEKKMAKDGNNLEDILSSMYGFTSSTKTSNRSLADMVKESDALSMDPLSVRIRDWTSGKERNIRALLGSLNAVLWEEAAEQWKQPTMAELFAAENVRKHYRRACLVVHPDKLMGSVHEPLAKAIFTELNDGWTEFQKISNFL